jgi:hypothetical protein
MLIDLIDDGRREIQLQQSRSTKKVQPGLIRAAIF